MDINQSSFDRLNRPIWTVIATIAVIILVSSAAGPFQIGWSSYLKIAPACVLLYGAGLFYSTIRKDPKLAVALMSTCQIGAFSAVAAPLSYIAASAGLPLWDANFTLWDHSLGFDWLALLANLNAHPAFHTVLALAYSSFTVQMTTIVITLTWANKLQQLQLVVLSFIVVTLVTIAVSTAMPSQGVWGHLQLSSIDHPAIAPVTQEGPHLPVFYGLREGTVRLLVAEGAEGIISFPSLHAAIGLLFIFALWPVRYIRWIAVLLNVTMIVATPIDGGHYFSDVIAGLAITTLCWIAINRAFAPTAKGTIEQPKTLIVTTPSIALVDGGELNSEELDITTPSFRMDAISSTQ